MHQVDLTLVAWNETGNTVRRDGGTNRIGGNGKGDCDYKIFRKPNSYWWNCNTK